MPTYGDTTLRSALFDRLESSTPEETQPQKLNRGSVEVGGRPRDPMPYIQMFSDQCKPMRSRQLLWKQGIRMLLLDACVAAHGVISRS